MCLQMSSHKFPHQRFQGNFLLCLVDPELFPNYDQYFFYVLECMIMFWAWVRKQLRARDMAELRARRVVPGKMAYTMRVKKLLKSRRAQQVASKIALGFKRVCMQVAANKGAASKA